MRSDGLPYPAESDDLTHQRNMMRMPGAVLMTRLQVYNTHSPDGQISGTPHVHLACTEMYVVSNGRGAVEMIDKAGFSRVELKQHDALLFSPGTIHRLINPDGNLEILVIMQNSGLPERGDNVVCFTEEWLSSDSAYAEAMKVHTLQDAYRRRDLAVEGFFALKAAYEAGQERGQEALRCFYELAKERTAPYHAEWQDMIQQGAVREAQKSLNHVSKLQKGDLSHLFESEYVKIRGAESSLGFCGHLNRYCDPASLLPEGIRES